MVEFFAKFELCIWNPGSVDGVNQEQIRKLENLLDCELVQFIAGY